MKQFWKKVCTWCLLAAIAICALSSTGCMTVPTNHTQKQTYQAGEIIRIYDNKSEARLATLVVTDVRIVRDEPYTDRDFLCSVEDFDEYAKRNDVGETVTVGTWVYEIKEYVAVVQINYDLEVIDSGRDIDYENFSITCEGMSVDWEADTAYDRIPTEGPWFAVGVQKKGDINLSFRLDSVGEFLCSIKCEYDPATNSYIIVEDPTAEPRCTACSKEIDYDDAYCKYCGQKQK